MKVMLIGNPNCGKTTLFNLLTGENQKIGNWPGVTVEKRQGKVSLNQSLFDLIDLPGIYSLSQTIETAQDEKIAKEAIQEGSFDLIINVVDAVHLERHLYLTSQILELGKPTIIALNFMDKIKDNRIQIDIDKLSNKLSCPVVPVEAHHGTGIEKLKEILLHKIPTPKPLHVDLPQAILQKITEREARGESYYEILRDLEENTETVGPYSMDIQLADARYTAIHQLVNETFERPQQIRTSFTAFIDKIVLNRFFGIPIFLVLMYVTFLIAIKFGGIFQDFFNIITHTIFVEGVATFLHYYHAPLWLLIVARGIGQGINTTLTFIPIIASMYFVLSFLETSGYMARAAFIVDKVMRSLGLPGKSFVAMIVGFGCNVPGVMASRTLESEKERILTIVISPFMSCSARLTIYALFVSVFFPSHGQNIVFSLYLLGILMAIFTGLILRKTFLPGTVSPLILELPDYQKPSFYRLAKETKIRLFLFIRRAGFWIIPACVLLSILENWSFSNGDSILAFLAKKTTPLFTPMGIDKENWPAVVGLISGLLAKEVVVGTLNTLYSMADHSSTSLLTFHSFIDHVLNAFDSIRQHFQTFVFDVIHPFAIHLDQTEIERNVSLNMSNRFKSASAAYAYLIFILLYIPCVSTMAVIRQEAGSKWMWFSIIWSLLLAYLLAVLFYQFSHYPWIISLMGAFVLTIMVQQSINFKRKQEGNHAFTNP